jgi:hypothetical protein
LTSIAPLDRIRNQALDEDNITVRVRCEVPWPGTGKSNDWDFTFDLDDVDYMTCLDHADDDQRSGGKNEKVTKEQCWENILNREKAM